jgi:hypothetical protein
LNSLPGLRARNRKAPSTFSEHKRHRYDFNALANLILKGRGLAGSSFGEYGEATCACPMPRRFRPSKDWPSLALGK